MLESIIPKDIEKTNKDTYADFKIKVTPRTGKSPQSGNLYFKLTSAYAGKEDISFFGTVLPDGENNTFVPRVPGMPYVAGWRAEGIDESGAVAKITSSGATLKVGILGFDTKVTVTRDSMVKFMQAISVEYAWVDEAV